MAIRIRTLTVEQVRALPLLAGSVLLALVVGVSTARAGWVSGAGALPGLAVYAALVGCALGISSARPRTALTLAVAPAPVAAFLTVAGTPQAGQLMGWDLVQRWWTELQSGQAASDAGFLLLLLYALFWLLGVWVAWGLVRRRQPLLAAAPAGAVLATNVLNYPDGQDAAVFWFLVLLMGLLLWATFQDSVAAARRHGAVLADGARWDFWERGAIAAAGLVALGVLSPPLTAIDQTADVQNGVLQAWARVAHGMASAGDGAGATSVGFSSYVQLGGPLVQTSGTVLTYQKSGSPPGPDYFRGLDLVPLQGEWGVVDGFGNGLRISAGEAVPYTESYQAQQAATYTIDMLRPPGSAPDLVFAPGQLTSVNRNVTILQGRSGRRGIGFAAGQLDTVDRVTAATSTGTYQVQVEQSIASVAQLRADGTDYADWVLPYRTFPAGYRSDATLQRVHDLAVRVTAGASDPYEQAVVVETYLRDNFTYTLTPPAPPPGVDPEEAFLFTSRAGYCQYFATAMADMLRSLGVPVRLVNGYGPGTYDSSTQRWVVHESDAHTWPEVYFPTYGWIPFEPTADGVYSPIPRGAGATTPCTGASCPSPSAPASTPAPATTANPAPNGSRGGSGGGPGRLTLPTLRTWTPVGAAILVLLALLLLAVSRFLRPQTVWGAWRRATLLLRLGGLRARTGETPIEFGDRVAGEFPEAAAGIRRLAGEFAVAAYAPPWLAEATRPTGLAHWGALRPLLLRRVLARARHLRR